MPSFRTGKPHRRRNALITSGGAVAAGIVLIAAVAVFILHAVAPGAIRAEATPLWQAGNGTASAFEAFASIFGNSAALTAERDRLREDSLALAEENRTLRGQVSDLTRLMASSTPAHRALAGVLARPPVAPYDTLIVGAGKNVGVKDGAFVYGPGDVPLGTVSHADAATSEVALFCAGGRSTDGWVGDARVPVTLIGKGAGAFEATLPRDSGVAVNAVVYVPGPGALPVGTVVKIDSDPSSPRDTIHIAPYANLFSLTWVSLSL